MECNLPRLEIKKRFGFVKGGKGGENREGGREREREAGGWEVNGGGVGCLNSLMLQIVSEKERGAERARTK